MAVNKRRWIREVPQKSNLAIRFTRIDYVMEVFFRPDRIFAVAGASNDPKKFGYKVLKWYIDRNLPVVPINPKEEIVQSLDTVPSINDIVLPKGKRLSLSVVTPPAATKSILQSATPNLVSAVWLQPGTYDAETFRIAKDTVPTVIDDCVLVNGDNALHISKF